MPYNNAYISFETYTDKCTTLHLRFTAYVGMAMYLLLLRLKSTSIRLQFDRATSTRRPTLRPACCTAA